MDTAASEFYKDGKYDLDFKNPASDPSKWLTGKELGSLYHEFIDNYPIVTIEDCFDQDDWDNWTEFTASTDIQIVGDDLLVTNPKRIKTGIEKKACNALLLKVSVLAGINKTKLACLKLSAVLVVIFESS